MIEFVKRLSQEQIGAFFDGNGEIKAIKSSSSEGMLDVIFKEDCGKLFWYSISDDFISAYGFSKTSEDWKFYLYSIFGEEYLTTIREEPVPNNFVEKLSINDIEQLLFVSRIITHDIEEKEAFRKGTRRFKVNTAVPVKSEIEVIIGPHIDYCSGISSLTEKTFMQFFTKKFGMDFINYYIDIEKQIEGRKIEMFKEKCNQRVIGKLNYMVKIVEDNN